MSSDRFNDLVELVHKSRGLAEQHEQAEVWHLAAGSRRSVEVFIIEALRERAPELASIFEERVTRTITRPPSATDRLTELADY